ncbi:MAG: CotH kinase family protein, partial [Candidatus Pacebacteria bacterium]|nr:CotH kinase family protein [Candidatus Paceibacterota bacterium]
MILLKKRFNTKSFWRVQIATHGLAQIDYGGSNTRIFFSKEDSVFHVMIKDFDNAFAAIGFNSFASGFHNTHESMWGHDRALIAQALLRNQAFKHEYINVCADMLSSVLSTSSMQRAWKKIYESLSPHLDMNHQRWSHLAWYEPDQQMFLDGVVPSVETFINDQPSFISQVFEEYFDLGVNMVLVEMRDSCSFERPLAVYINDLVLVKKDSVLIRHSFTEVPVPLRAVSDFFSCWVINTDTLYTADIVKVFSSDTSYTITAVFTCPTIDPNIGNIVINEIVSSNQHIVTNHPQGKFEDYIEL